MSLEATEKRVDARPDIEQDPVKILKWAFASNPSLTKDAESIVEALKRDGLIFVDDHRLGEFERELPAIALDFVFDAGSYDFSEAWFFPYIDSYDGQCKNPLYVDASGRLHVHRRSQGSIVTYTVLKKSKKQGFLSYNKKEGRFYHEGLLVQPFSFSFTRKEGGGPYYYVTLLIRSEDAVALFEKCWPKKAE